MKTKLHLGCGLRHLQDYVNIDFPLNKHSVQEQSVADEHHDITKLSYQKETINEIRLHHLFEHFTRPVACALAASWNSWLVKDGIVHIEVPDFEKTTQVAMSRITSTHKKKVAIRHLFGSHEANWAIHCEGYSIWLLKELLTAFGFEITDIRRNSWNATHNIEVIARKTTTLTQDNARVKAQEYLKGFLLDNSELKLLNIWLEEFNSQLSKTWATNRE